MNLSNELVPWLHDSRVDIIQLKKQQSLSHALLLMGRDGGGHHQLAECLGRDILCQNTESDRACGECHSCHLVAANTHPDFHLLDGREESIKVDQIRSILGKITTKPQIGNSKFVFLAQASSMNVNAANAILKVLEEPPAETFFILTSDATARLLPTIRSRCMLMKLPSPSESETKKWLEQLNLTEDLSSVFWVTQEPFTLSALAQSNKLLIYKELPNNLCRYLLGDCSIDDVLAKLDSKNNIDFIRGMLALSHQCICYSTGEKNPNIEVLQECFDTLLAKLGIHKIIQCFQRLQELVDNSHKTHLNMQLQLKSELIFWRS